jgi:translocation and assembly module TamA
MPRILSTRRSPALVLAAFAAIARPAHAEVELSGVEGNIAANVLAYLSVDDFDCDTEERVMRREFNDAPEQIAEAVSVYGYYAPHIDSALEFADECWQASFAIGLGEPVTIRKFDVELSGEAATNPEFASVLATSPLRAGANLNHAAYEQFKRQLTDLARDRGYADAVFTASSLDVYPDELAADITLHFDSGERYRFGEITLDQDVLRDDFVRAFIDLHAGDPYDSRELTSTYVSLSESGYFQRADIRQQPPDRETKTISVTIGLTSAARRLISYGVGFSTDTGPRVRFGRVIRRWNERGHQLGFNAMLSPLVTEVTANYRMPFGNPRYQWASFDAGIKKETTETSSSDAIEFGARRVYERAGRWSRTELLSYAIEDFEIGSQVGRSRLLTPGFSWSRIRAENTLRPVEGSRIEFEIRGAADRFGSDTSFVQATADAKWISSFKSQARIIVRGTFGITDEKEFEDLPPSVRFFAGGDNSIRGYGFEELGPKNADGDVIGGPRLAVASVEYEHPVKPKWTVALFADSGNAFEGSNIDAKTSTGIGARWLSPLGPIRIDVGVPLNDPGHDARLHVTLGPDL